MGKFDFLYNCKGEERTIGDLIEYAFANKEKRKMLDSVPPRCSGCKLLDYCRDKEHGYKCFDGCLIINARNNLPWKCKDCDLLYICRKEEQCFDFRFNRCMLFRKGEQYKKQT